MKQTPQEQTPQAEKRHLPWRYKLILAGAAALAISAHRMTGLPLALCGEISAVLAIAAIIATASHQVFHWGRRKADRGRGRRAHGFASLWEMHRHLSVHAVRRHTKWTHPHLDLGRFHRTDAHDIGVMIGRHGFRRVIGSVEQFYLLVAPPRTIKTLWFSAVLHCWRGPALAASTRLDFALHTIKARAKLGHVWIVNPERLGNIPSTVQWSPLAGCGHPQTAIHRAGVLAEAGPKTGDMKAAGFWDSKGFQLLRIMMHAAALEGHPITQAWHWCLNPRDPEPLRILTQPGVPAPDWAAELRTILALDSEALAVAASQAGDCLAWLADPEMIKIACPAPGQGIDLTEFVHSRDTIYLVAEDQARSSAAPFFACFTSALYTTAKHEAACQPGGRLARKLLIQLDEATNTCKVDAPRIGSQAGGLGCTFMISAQTIPAIFEAWGDKGGQTVLDNACKIIGPGFDNPDMAEEISAACGSHGRHGDRNGHGERVLPVNRIRTLKPPRAIMMHRSLRPVFIRLTRVSDVPGYDQATAVEAAILLAASADAAAAQHDTAGLFAEQVTAAA